MTVFIGVIRFHVLHGGKGMCLSVLTEDVLEYYIILYKATLALPSRKEFHYFVFELLHQLDRQGIQPLKPNLVAQAVTYIREHFSRPITLESIAEDLECSTGHLSRLFKSKMHTSPIHYLGQIRANRAAELLMQTDALCRRSQSVWDIQMRIH
ncbi:helix-turn-helix domain-containing protein [Paenibacillus sp. BT-177]|uniref:helix-turn-helix domain-containing protein n=1 Tax=Paenibacillus sp. BT-177 TaxID=2986930 RepID=UPI0021F79046|nr:AraC family transcriptional regulator [Paenibacillus sp. BT-177]